MILLERNHRIWSNRKNKENYIEDVLENEELKLNDDIIKFNKPLVFRKDKMIIANSYNVYLYRYNDNLILKIFNNNIIHEEVVDTNHKHYLLSIRN